MKAIGVFDSGLGGLTVVRELKRQLPAEDIIYLGDTAHLPYGTKSAEAITRLTLNNVLFLLKQKVKLIIVACNSASSLALSSISRYFSVPIIGVIEPGVKQAVRITETKCIGIIGTPATIRSGEYEKQIKKIDPSIKVISQACPLFVPLVEAGWINQSETFTIAKKYLDSLLVKNKKTDTLILGCTHYPLLKPVFKKILGEKIRLIDSAEQVVRQVAGVLHDQGLARKSSDRGARCRFYVSDDPDGFAYQARSFLGQRLSKVQRINHV
ncbi:MAG: glutamate racemase [Candidatus Omnitrophica bacterium]|nr:glutamate racemase [Candidatus Omnitrophota bacterium]